MQSKIINNILQLQGDVAAKVGFLPVRLQNRIAKALGVDKGLGNADAHMRILLGVQRIIGDELVSENYKKSRRGFRAQMLSIQGKPLTMQKVTNFTIENPNAKDEDGAPATLALRHYVPKDMSKVASTDAHSTSVYETMSENEQLPLLVFFHGGGFVVGDLDTHDEFCRYFAHNSGMQVLSVDYRLAPEHPAPAAIEDAQIALKWAYDNAAKIGADAERIFVGGDSAGGNIATVVACTTKDEHYAPKAQLLIYPATDIERHYASYDQFGHGLPISTKDVSTFEYLYVHTGQLKPADPLVAPMRAEVDGICPAYVITAEIDLLVDEGEAYAHKLRNAGTTVYSERIYGQPHGFINMINIHKGAKLESIRLAMGFADFVADL